MIGGLIRDLRLAGRSMRRRPGFTFVSVFILALAIGGVTVMFTNELAFFRASSTISTVFRLG